MTRLFVENSLNNQTVEINTPLDIHYLVKVMRKKIGDKIFVFNQNDGEFSGEIKEISSKKISLINLKQTKSPSFEPILKLIFSPIKHPKIHFLLEKATELGVTHLIPIQTKHSVIDKINLEKWQIYVKEASEQCERISIPVIEPLITLNKFLSSWPNDCPIIFCNEKEKDISITDWIKSHSSKKEEISVMIGPEGGFSKDELALLKSKNFINSVHLGERILRSETASLVSLALCQNLR